MPEPRPRRGSARTRAGATPAPTPRARARADSGKRRDGGEENGELLATWAPEGEEGQFEKMNREGRLGGWDPRAGGGGWERARRWLGHAGVGAGPARLRPRVGRARGEGETAWWAVGVRGLGGRAAQEGGHGARPTREREGEEGGLGQLGSWASFSLLLFLYYTHPIYIKRTT